MNSSKKQQQRKRCLKLNTYGTQIANLIVQNGKTGPEMTHALKDLGEGDMQKGITRIAEYFLTESSNSLKVGRLQGTVGGVVGVGLLLLIIKLFKDSKKNSKRKEEGKVILKCLEKNLLEDKAVEASPEENKEV